MSCCFSLLNLQAQDDVGQFLEAAQGNDTSAINARIELFWVYLNSDLEEAKNQLDEASSNPALNSFPIGEAKVKKCYGIYHSVKGNFEKATSFINESLTLSKKHNAFRNVISCYNELGIIASEQGNFEEALNHYYKAKELYKELGDKNGEANMLVNIGGVYWLLKKYNTGKKILLKAIEKLKTIGNQRGLMKAYHMLSNIYVNQNELAKAIEIMQKEKKLAIALNDQYQLTTIHHSLGTFYDKAQQPDSAIHYWEKALHSFSKFGAKQGQAMVMFNIAGAEFNRKNTDKALNYATEAMVLAKEIKIMKTVTEGHDLLMQIHKAKKNFEQALHHSQRYNKLNDSLIGLETRSKLDEMDVKFKTREHEIENELLIKQDNINSLKIKQQTYLIVGLIACVVLIIGITFFYIKQRKTKELQRRAELEQKALRAQMNPHFIFNSLNSIHRMFMEGDYDIANDYIGDFGELLRIILNNSGKSSISVNDEVNTLKLYLDIEKMRTGGMIEYHLHVDSTIDLLNNFIPPLIIQPFVENAIWHGILPTERIGEITIDIRKKDNDLLICTITDNGIGIEQSKKQKEVGTQQHISKGMEITEDRLRIANAVNAEELATGGTRVTILIPLSL